MPRRDCTGQLLQVGDAVSIVGIPDLAGMSETGRKESEPIFAYLVGKYKRIREFNEQGLAELRFRISGSPVLHFVWLEPFLLRKKQTRGKV